MILDTAVITVPQLSLHATPGMRFEIEEKHTWSLTSSTTCYSGARTIQAATAKHGASLSLATALHTLQVSVSADADPVVVSTPVNDDNHADCICVGQAVDADYNVSALLSPVPQFLSDEAEPETALRDLLYADADTASVTASTTVSMLSEASTVATHQRRTSSGDTDILSAAATLEAVPPTETSVKHNHMIQGRLVWKQGRKRRATVNISFRPLAMTLGRVSIQTSSAKAVSRPVVWMGSADASRLLAYYWEEETSQLHPLMLDEKIFLVASPVMAIAVCPDTNNDNNNKSSSRLALACQDGTVRCLELFSYQATSEIWSARQISEIIVDGPLVCVQFVPQTMHVLVGSLCGYVMRQDEQGNPTLVADGLAYAEMEDSVLAVYGWDNLVALGTQTGRLAIYERIQGSDDYSCAGQWTLPYSIHEICFQSPDALWVTTRKSLHWFVLKQVPQPDVGLAKERIRLLLERVSFDYWNEYPSKRPSVQTEQDTPEEKQTQE